MVNSFVFPYSALIPLLPLYKAMPLKPNVLKEYTAERAITPVLNCTSYVSENDKLFLEDEHGRTLLVGVSFKIDRYLTGTCVAVRGRGDEESGEFETIEIITAGLAPQLPLQIAGTNASVYVVLLSGINIGVDGVNPLHFHMLVEYITGNLGSPKEHSFQKNIARVVIAGNSIFTKDEQMFHDQSLRFSKKEMSNMTKAVQEFDKLLLSMASSCPIDLMPGEQDPANFMLPQQPLNKCLLPASSKLPTLTLSPNPHSFSLNGVECVSLFLGGEVKWRGDPGMRK
eukprot:TRINITY_DN8533_c0_g1_i4.p1 TRINITY_DN8533_c0_g1~~TRINITY_DN8533_c0_g1_i4.p1  ORF type:complete len:284 (-),score=66.44 TRINITY_DN8533_c0_g1_i4:778-1629(-)